MKIRNISAYLGQLMALARPGTLSDAQLQALTAHLAEAPPESAAGNRTLDFTPRQTRQDAPGSTISARASRDSGPHPLDAANRREQNACASESRQTTRRCNGRVDKWDTNPDTGEARLVEDRRPCGRRLNNVPSTCIVCGGNLCHSCCNKTRPR